MDYKNTYAGTSRGQYAVASHARNARVGLLQPILLLFFLWLVGFQPAIAGASEPSHPDAKAAKLTVNPDTQIASGITSLEPDADTLGKGEQVENRNSKFQVTYVWQRKSAFTAPYSGTNSLTPELEKRSYSLSATAYFGARVWQGGEVYFNPEVIMSQSLSSLTGLGGLTNGENQKGGGANPTFYNARLFLRQTWGFGGGSEKVESAANQLAGTIDKHRLVLTAGKIGLIDVFDGNAFSHDPRTQFLNWSLMTHGAFDYAADQRGYTVGAALEYYHDDWVFRIGRFEQPKESNGLPLDSRIMAHHGDQFEIEHGYEIAGQPGKLRLLAFHNEARMGGFQNALDLWKANGKAGVPDVGNVRKDQSKYGFGINLEQNLDNDIGLFIRASWNDGSTETYAFTEIERSLSGGVMVKGTAWSRPNDILGLGYACNGLSSVHRAYLAAGGLGVFIGDGRLNYQPEEIFEGFYNLNITRNTLLTLDYQHIANPAYNTDRGPVSVAGVRLHWGN
ncbi:MAG: carbohydrate porin [Gallionellaceae bacterium]|nr:carbohydrate porin [Gallionellaceae bacterium]